MLTTNKVQLGSRPVMFNHGCHSTEFLKHAISDYLGRVTYLFSLRLSNKKNNNSSCWCGSVSGLSAGQQSKGSLVRFPVRAHAWVSGQVPSTGCTRGNHTLMFLSLSFSLPSPLKINKIFFIKDTWTTTGGEVGKAGGVGEGGEEKAENCT